MTLITPRRKRWALVVIGLCSLIGWFFRTPLLIRLYVWDLKRQVRAGDHHPIMGAIRLGRVGPPAITAALKLLETPEAGLHYAGFKALGEIKDPSTIPAILPWLERSKALALSPTNLLAVQALEAIGHPSGVPSLQRAFQTADLTYKPQIASALLHCGDRSVVPFLIHRLPEGLELMGRFRLREAIPAILNLLDHRPELALKARAVNSLIYLQPDLALGPGFEVMETVLKEVVPALPKGGINGLISQAHIQEYDRYSQCLDALSLLEPFGQLTSLGIPLNPRGSKMELTHALTAYLGWWKSHKATLHLNENEIPIPAFPGPVSAGHPGRALLLAVVMVWGEVVAWKAFFKKRRIQKNLPPRNPSPHRPIWTWKDLVICLIIFVGTLTWGSFLTDHFGARHLFRTMWYPELLTGIAFTLWVSSMGVLLSRKQLSIQAIGLRTEKWVSHIKGGAMGFFIGLPFVAVGGAMNVALWTAFHWSVMNPQISEMFARLQEGRAAIWSVSMVCVIGPILEEVIFRGHLHHFIRNYTGVPMGIGLSSLFFAAVHGLPMIILPLWISGCVFAYLYERTQSLIPSMMAHCLNNALMVLSIGFFQS